MHENRGSTRRGLIAAALALGWCAAPADACIRATYSIGRITSESAHVSIYRVTAVNAGANVVTWTKVRDLKGRNPAETIPLNVGYNGEFTVQGQGPGFCGREARDYRDVMELSRLGKEIVFFLNPAGNIAEVCMGDYWFQATGGGNNWNLYHSEPIFSLAFAGRTANLAKAVEAMLTGQEVVVPSFRQSDSGWLPLLSRTAKQQRIRASLKLQDYNPQRDFVSWGGDSADLRALRGMPGFAQYGALATLAPGPSGVACADFTGDGKEDLCLYNRQTVRLMEYKEGGFSDFTGVIIGGGAYSAAWGDYNGDGKPDLLLATPGGLRLFANTGSNLVETTSCLPRSPYPHFVAAAWVRSGKNALPDIVAADGFRGLLFYRNRNAKAPAAALTANAPAFDDASSAAGLGPDGLAADVEGDHLAVADVDGDGREDVLFSAGAGVLLLNTAAGFQIARQAGIQYQAGGVAPVFGDCNGDGQPDLFVPQRQGPSRLFVNEGGGRFRDVTAKAGALAAPLGQATCAVWADFCGSGRQDLLVGCVYGPNRCLRNDGTGVFKDGSDALGLDQVVYSTFGLCTPDVNGDGVPDLIMANSGSESAFLIGSRNRMANLNGAATR